MRADSFNESVIERLRVLLPHLNARNGLPWQVVDVPLVMEIINIRKVDGKFAIVTRSGKAIAAEVHGRCDSSLCKW